jgi:hypothetical protein
MITALEIIDMPISTIPSSTAHQKNATRGPTPTGYAMLKLPKNTTQICHKSVKYKEEYRRGIPAQNKRKSTYGYQPFLPRRAQG